jgi:hypothetical protein
MFIKKNANNAMDASSARWSIASTMPMEMQKIVIGNDASIAFVFYRYRDCS